MQGKQCLSVGSCLLGSSGLSTPHNVEVLSAARTCHAGSLERSGPHHISCIVSFPVGVQERSHTTTAETSEPFAVARRVTPGVQPDAPEGGVGFHRLLVSTVWHSSCL